jgi:hypothetical protein
MPEGSPFAASWWFRKSFTLPAAYRGKTVWLHLDDVAGGPMSPPAAGRS